MRYVIFLGSLLLFAAAAQASENGEDQGLRSAPIVKSLAESGLSRTEKADVECRGEHCEARSKLLPDEQTEIVKFGYTLASGSSDDGVIKNLNLRAGVSGASKSSHAGVQLSFSW